MEYKICNSMGCSKCGRWQNNQPVKIEFAWERDSRFGTQKGIYSEKTTYNKINEIKQRVLSENVGRKITKIKVYSYVLLEEVNDPIEKIPLNIEEGEHNILKPLNCVELKDNLFKL